MKTLSALFLLLSLTQVSCSPSYSLQFEILSYENAGNRLATGECCSPSPLLPNSTSQGSECAADCNPYWKVCISEIEADKNFVMPETRTSFLPRKSKRQPVRSSSRDKWTPSASKTSHADTNAATTATVRTTSAPKLKAAAISSNASLMASSKQSILKSFLNRILGTMASFGNFMASGDLDQSKSSCSVASWTTNVSHPYPISFTRKVPKSLLTAFPRSSSFLRLESSLPATWRSSDSESSRKAVLVLEVWHREVNASDRLISRHAEQQDLTFQNVTAADSLLWDESSSSSDANTSAFKNRWNRVSFKYRWRIVRDPDEVADAVETSTKLICSAGYTGSDCKEAVCANHCHTSHGYCDVPGECKCKFGWKGEECSNCVPMPGCVHGQCIKPFECRCEEGWTGMFCDKPTCKIGCHPQNGYCEKPGECRCRFGFKGDNCSDCATMPGCQRGSCDQPLDCLCDQGWRGLFCSIPVCAPDCDLDHGWCRRPSECRCRTGWTGKNCTECVPYPGCEHGTCSEPWTCNCEPSWGGITCSEKLDFCEKQSSSTCQNGATCVSIDPADGSFVCQCPSGHEGRFCEKIKT